jgi:hypothetical protein
MRDGRGWGEHGSAAPSAEAASAEGPGKATRVEAAAAHGVSGAGGPLPHLARIQASFGHHDLGGVRAHTDARAAAGAGAMGARGFAVGDRVAFDGAPDLHLAAHEAAHVVQQRGGVQLDGGVGQDDDAHERHADAVADRVVAGQDASSLLDLFGHRGAPSAGVQQRKARPGAAPKPVVTVDGAGVLRDPAGERVGFRGSDGKSYVGVDLKGKLAPLAGARLGTIRLGAARVIARVEEATLEPVPEVDAISGGGTPDPKAMADQRTITTTGKPIAVIDGDGAQVLRLASTWQPIAPSALPAAIASKLDDQARIDLDDGSAWVWMAFALRDERAETARWVPPAHSKQEVDDRDRSIRAEAGKLPSGSDADQAVQRVTKTISVISTVEGDFGSESTSEDDHASLGIFQWAMTKGSSADAGSLGQFFRTLKQRSAAAGAKPEKDRSEEDKLYLRAWKQCTAQGLDVAGKKITIHGKPATGGEVEGAMSEEMAKGSLRSYQLIAAKDWIEEFRATVVRPGPAGADAIGHGYSETADGKSAVLTAGANSLALDAAAPATVGSLFASEKAVANAIMLGVNRPNFVEAALWRALAPTTDPKAEAEARLTALMAILAPEPTGAKQPRKPTAHRFTAADIDAAGADAKRLYGELRAILWPNRALDAAAQQQLESEFKKQALKLYSPADAKKYHRERRFSTVEASW